MIEYESNEGGMPCAQLAEDAILCCLMRYPQEFPALLTPEGIDADCFFKHRRLFDQMMAYIRANPENEEVDSIHFVQFLDLHGSLNAIGGAAQVMNLVTHPPVENWWRKYSDQLKEAKARRLTINAAKRLSEATNSVEAIQSVKETLDALTLAVSVRGKSKDAKKAGDEFIRKWMSDHETGEIPGKATGFSEVDTISGGMRPGELWVIGGQTSRGKSVVMMQIAATFLKRSEHVAIFSLEMMTHEVTGRLVCVMGSVSYGAITQPRTASKGDLGRIQRGAKEYMESNVWVDDSTGQTLEMITAESQRLHDLNRIDLIVIDYIQLIEAVHQKGVNREQELAKISKGLKQLGKKIGCPVLTATQLNEQGQSRESRAIQQDADSLLYIGDDGIRVCKMRNGKRDAMLSLFLHGEKQLFLTYQPPK